MRTGRETISTRRAAVKHARAREPRFRGVVITPSHRVDPASGPRYVDKPTAGPSPERRWSSRGAAAVAVGPREGAHGSIEVSATRKPATPRTRPWESTTTTGGCCSAPMSCRSSRCSIRLTKRCAGTPRSACRVRSGCRNTCPGSAGSRYHPRRVLPATGFVSRAFTLSAVEEIRRHRAVTEQCR